MITSQKHRYETPKRTTTSGRPLVILTPPHTPTLSPPHPNPSVSLQTLAHFAPHVLRALAPGAAPLRTRCSPACFLVGFGSHPLWNDVEMGTDMTTPKGDKSASEGDAAVAGATKAAVRKLGQELGIPAAQLPLEDFSFLTKVGWV